MCVCEISGQGCENIIIPFCLFRSTDHVVLCTCFHVETDCIKIRIIFFWVPLQYDAFEMGIITTDDFTNADILEATYPAVAKRLTGDWMSDPAIPIVTGFLGKVLLI